MTELTAKLCTDILRTEVAGILYYVLYHAVHTIAQIVIRVDYNVSDMD